MANFRERAEAEFENIDKVLAQFPPCDTFPELSTLELAGVAALIHSLYNGLENILKQAVLSKGIKLPQGQTWHRDLVESALSQGIISQATEEAIKQYLAFRHFFSHAYAFELYADRIIPLVEGAVLVVDLFKKDIDKLFK